MDLVLSTFNITFFSPVFLQEHPVEFGNCVYPRGFHSISVFDKIKVQSFLWRKIQKTAKFPNRKRKSQSGGALNLFGKKIKAQVRNQSKVANDVVTPVRSLPVYTLCTHSSIHALRHLPSFSGAAPRLFCELSSENTCMQNE